MDYRYLKAFLLTAQHASFSRAASELRIAQSAISRQIKLLEESVGEQLIMRSPKQVSLTPAGRRLFAEASRFDRWAASEFKEVAATIRVGALAGIVESWLLLCLCERYRDKPLSFVVRSDNPSNIVDMLRMGELDFGLINQELQSDQMSSWKLFSEEMVLISRKGSDIDDLESQRWIFMGPAAHMKLVLHDEPRRTMQVNSISAVIKLAENGFGVSVVPRHLVSRNNKLSITNLSRIKPETIYLVSPNYRIWPAHLEEWRREIVRFARQSL